MSFESILSSEFQIKEAEMSILSGGQEEEVPTGHGIVVTADGAYHDATDSCDGNGGMHYQW